MSGRLKTLVGAAALMLAVVAGGGAARAAAPFDITLAGPSSFFPGQALSGPFTGRLSVAGIGVPNQTIELSVDGQPVATGTTTAQGSYAFSVPPFTGTADRTVRATALGGTPLETSADLVVPVVRFPVTVTLSGTGTGSVSSSPAAISCPAICSADFPATSQVTLTATPGPNSVFTGWSNGCIGTGPCAFNMYQAHSATASFGPNTALLTVQRTGAGNGFVSSSPAGINCGVDCSEAYVIGTPVTLTASPFLGSTFVGWSGAGCTGTGACNVTMNTATTVTANFALQSYTLFVVKGGSQAGTVTSSPPGINCGGSCSATYPYGSMVTLSANPDPLHTFTGWSGSGCTGTGSCIVTMNFNTSVTATFS